MEIFSADLAGNNVTRILDYSAKFNVGSQISTNINTLTIDVSNCTYVPAPTPAPPTLAPTPMPTTTADPSGFVCAGKLKRCALVASGAACEAHPSERCAYTADGLSASCVTPSCAGCASSCAVRAGCQVVSASGCGYCRFAHSCGSPVRFAAMSDFHVFIEKRKFLC
jgi:hypothetical protein